jgi:cell division protein ZapB
MDKEIHQLERRVEELIGACRQLKQENSKLKMSCEHLAEERSVLQDKHRQARGRIESIIDRLRVLDRGSR